MELCGRNSKDVYIMDGRKYEGVSFRGSGTSEECVRSMQELYRHFQSGGYKSGHLPSVFTYNVEFESEQEGQKGLDREFLKESVSVVEGVLKSSRRMLQLDEEDKVCIEIVGCDVEGVYEYMKTKRDQSGHSIVVIGKDGVYGRSRDGEDWCVKDKGSGELQVYGALEDDVQVLSGELQKDRVIDGVIRTKFVGELKRCVRWQCIRMREGILWKDFHTGLCVPIMTKTVSTDYAEFRRD